MKGLTPKQIYNRLGKAYDECYKDRIHQLEDDYIYKFLNDNEFGKGKLLDIGSGTGSLLNSIRIKPKNYTGLDISEKMIEISSKKFPEYRFVLGTMTNIPFEDNSFDSIVSLFGSFSYAYNHKKAVREIKRLLKANGRFMIMACGKPYKHRKSYILNKFDIDSPAHFFSQNELIDLFKDFDNVKVFAMTWLSENLSKHLPNYYAKLYHNFETKYLSRIIPDKFYFHIITGRKHAETL